MAYNTLRFFGKKIPALFGIDDERLPPEGLDPRMVDGFKVWVEPLARSREAGKFHRAMLECPHCGRTIPIGRFHQHLPIHTKGLANG